MTYFYLKNDGIYFKKEENSDERYLSSLTEQITQEAKRTIQSWKNDFDKEKLDPAQTDWLEECSIDLTYDDDSIESESFESEIVRQLFNQLVLREIGTIDAERVYSY
jgi:hypothetical protein